MITPLLDTLVDFESPSTAQDATFGSSVPVWTHFARAWVEWRDMIPSRSETVRQGLATARNQTRIRLRFMPDLDSSMRLVRDGVKYNIVGGPAELGRREWHELVVESYSTQGGT